MKIFYIGQKPEGAHCFITFATPDTPKVTWGPLYFTTEEMAQYALANPIPYLVSIQDTLGVYSEDMDEVLYGLALGYPGLKPDWISLNEGLIPLTATGAKQLATIEGNIWSGVFEGDIDDGSLPEKVLQEIGRALGISASDLHLRLISIRKSEETAQDVVYGAEGKSRLDEIEDFLEENVQVEIVPEEDTDLSKGYWIRTRGLSLLGRFELEIRNIPAVAIAPMQEEMGAWVFFFYLSDPLAKESIPTLGELDLTLSTEESKDPFWYEQGIECRTITVVNPPLRPTPIASPVERVLH